MGKYDDMIYMDRPVDEAVSAKYPPMSMEDRAKIFAPFAALRGHGDKLEEEDERLLYKVEHEYD